MAIKYDKIEQGLTITVGNGVPAHSGTDSEWVDVLLNEFNIKI
jgi:hypothetical protein